jgi:cobyrinic acid a,c-diamide synthase
MSFPRLALGATGPKADSRFVSLALMLAFRRRGVQLQHFYASACFSSLDVGPVATGLESRHLDSWLMPAGVCRELFARSAALVDLSVIEGCLRHRWTSEPGDDIPPHGANLWELSRDLDAPVVAVVRAGPVESFHIPRLEGKVDGVLIDAVRSPREYRTLATMFTGAWKVPVLGAVEALPEVRRRLDRLPPGARPPLALCEPLAESFARYARFGAISKLAHGAPFPEYGENLFARRWPSRHVKVAVALDEAFHCYFPDTLDLLECLGADVVFFSPLHDGRLPDGTDIVYVGCGHPERHTAALARNQCMISALKSHVCTGRRLYAESGGLAYLCQQIHLPDGSRHPMAGVLPAEAHRSSGSPEAKPVEAIVRKTNWLAPAGQRIRGYLNTAWRLEPVGPLDSCLGEGASRLDLVSSYHAIGSRLHLNFAAQPRIFRSFLRPHVASIGSV